MEKESGNKLLTFLKRFGLIIVFALVAVYGVIVLLSQQSRIDEVTRRNEELEAELAAAEAVTAELEAEKEHAGSDEYSEDAARDKLGWVKEDEIVFKDGTEAEEEE